MGYYIALISKQPEIGINSPQRARTQIRKGEAHDNGGLAAEGQNKFQLPAYE